MLCAIDYFNKGSQRIGFLQGLPMTKRIWFINFWPCIAFLMINWELTICHTMTKTTIKSFQWSMGKNYGSGLFWNSKPFSSSVREDFHHCPWTKCKQQSTTARPVKGSETKQVLCSDLESLNGIKTRHSGFYQEKSKKWCLGLGPIYLEITTSWGVQNQFWENPENSSQWHNSPKPYFFQISSIFIRFFQI